MNEWMKYEYRALADWSLEGQTKALQENPVLVLLYALHNPNRLAQVSTAGGETLTPPERWHSPTDKQPDSPMWPTDQFRE
jgi:hypothetical protein